MENERRQQKRIPFTHQVLINNSIKVNAINISTGGLCVQETHMFEVGSKLDLSFSEGSNIFALKAMVKYCLKGTGIGLEFVDMNAEQQAELNALISRLEAKTPSSARKKILIVDDNESVRRMNKGKLMLDGFQVFEAKDGVEAIKVLQTEQVDLIVLDLFMEPMDGFKVTALVRQMPQFKETPIIVFSARSTPEVMEQALNVGADLFLLKMTTSPVKLSENVKALLKK